MPEPLHKNIFVCCILLLLGYAALAQKHTAASPLDVDRLYQKYKNKSQIVIYTGNREITAQVFIAYNNANQPCAIILYGEANADTGNAIDKLKHELCSAKQKAGYKQIFSRRNLVNFEQDGSYEHNIEVSVFQKGSQYAKYGIKNGQDRAIVTQPDSVMTADSTPARYISDFFYFEVGDSSRKYAYRQQKLDF